jgi:hypothetical protein
MCGPLASINSIGSGSYIIPYDHVSYLTRGHSAHNFEFEYMDNLFLDVYYVHVTNEEQNSSKLCRTEVI